jgi:dTMP kinase
MKRNKKDIEYEVKFKQRLKRNPHKGLYVAFEGIDGAGKSVQSDFLDKYLREKGFKTEVTFQPRREGPVGKLIDSILKKEVSVPSVSLQYLYTADRIIDHVDHIEPALKEGKVVISHRCMWSNLPYGLLDKNMVDYSSDEARIVDVAHGLMSLYNQFMIPDYTFYLRVSAKTAMDRLKKKHVGLELYEKQAKLEKVLKGYEWQIKKYPGEFVVIDGEQDPNEVFKQVVKIVEEELS